MSLVDMVLAHQAWLLWLGLGVAAAGLLFRLVRPLERRALRTTWVLLVLSFLAAVVVRVGQLHPMLAPIAVNCAVVLLGLACIFLVATLFFRGLLPAIGLGAPRIAHDLSLTALCLAWAMVWLRMAGVDPSQLFTTSALITAVLAFSMQDTLGNVLGGVALQLDNSLRVGEWVHVDGVSGQVVDVHWRYTAVETRSRELVIIPNSWLMKNRFTVLRAPSDAPLAWRRAVQFNIHQGADPATVIRTLEHAVIDAEILHVLATPAPSAVLMEVAPGYCRYALRYWLGDPRHDDPSDSQVRIHALAALARAGIALGVPQEERLNIKENDSWLALADHREMAKRVDAIRHTDLFSHLPAPEQEALAARLVHAPFAQGDILTRQGAIAHWLYLITRGEVNVMVDGPQGRIKVSSLKDGAIFGEMGMLTGEPRSATVVAVTSVDCYRLDKEGFANVLLNRPEIAREMSAIVEQRNLERQNLLRKAGSRADIHEDLLARIRSFFSLRGA